MLEAHLPKNIYKNRGHRVDAGWRLMQATSDIFLGWLRGKQAATAAGASCETLKARRR